MTKFLVAGVFKTYGHGCSIDYEQAANWFERAAALGDPRVRDDAYTAMTELRVLLNRAHAANNAVIDSYHSRNERQ